MAQRTPNGMFFFPGLLGGILLIVLTVSDATLHVPMKDIAIAQGTYYGSFALALWARKLPARRQVLAGVAIYLTCLAINVGVLLMPTARSASAHLIATLGAGFVIAALLSPSKTQIDSVSPSS